MTNIDARGHERADPATRMNMRPMLRTRLRTEAGNVSVLFTVNPGRRTMGDNLYLLERVARDVASAYEQAVFERQRLPRTACRFTGVAALIFGLPCPLAAVVAHLAWALPLRELPTCGSLLPGVSMSVAGTVLLRLGRRV